MVIDPGIDRLQGRVDQCHSYTGDVVGKAYEDESGVQVQSEKIVIEDVSQNWS